MNIYISELIAKIDRLDDSDNFSLSLSGSVARIFSHQKIDKHFVLITKAGSDSLGTVMVDSIKDLEQIDGVENIETHLMSALEIDSEPRLKQSAASSIATEEIESILEKYKPSNIVVSGALLAINPSGSAISDAIAFSCPNARVIIDLSGSPVYYSSLELLKRNMLNLSGMDTFQIGDVLRIDGIKQIEEMNLGEYLD